VPLADAEKAGSAFGTALEATSLAALCAIPAEKILEATARPGLPRFSPAVDGYFLPKSPAEIFAAGEQAHVPLLAGWNSEENPARSVLGQAEATPENYAAAVKKLYPQRGDEILKVYPGATAEQVAESATALASDRFIAFSTWKWLDLHGRTGKSPTYRYYYSRPRPGARGAAHSAEIEYAMGNLASNKAFAWTADDEKVSQTMMGYFANFVKKGNPNGKGLPKWPKANSGKTAQVMHIDVATKAQAETVRDRYLLLDQTYQTK
jgi:para-nitrobenzyl esterase